MTKDYIYRIVVQAKNLKLEQDGRCIIEMINNLKAFSYQASLSLKRCDSEFTAGFCLSKAPFSELYTAYASFLHPKEQKIFAAMQYPKRQHSFLLGRYCAKLAAIADNQKESLTTFCIENGIFQQPLIYHQQYHNLQVSISHTDTFGSALVFPEAHPMAIDIEMICDSKKEIMVTQLTNDEQKVSKNNIKAIAVFWTAKEALSKVLKCGFTVPFELLEIENFRQVNHFYISHFKNFSQYQALSFLVADSICSIVYPKKTQLNLDIHAIQQLYQDCLT